MSEYDELLTFLTSSRLDIQEETLKIILHVLQSSPEESIQYFQQDSRMDIFMNLLKVPSLAIYTINILNLLLTARSEPSAVALTSTDSTLTTALDTPSPPAFPSQQYADQIMPVLITYLFTSTNSSLLNISLALLNNLTISIEYTELFISKVLVNPQIFQKLLTKFLEYNPQLEEDQEPTVDDQTISYHDIDPWQYFSSVLCNLCRDERIQLYLLNKSTNNMALLLTQIRSKNPIRRRGVVGSIRSCLFKSDFHWWLVEELNITTPLLLPLVVDTPITDEEKIGMDPILWMQGPNKKPDRDFEIQKLILESLLILCHTRIIRERLRVRKIYPIIRNLDYYQDNEEISAAIYEVVSQLIGNEDPSNPRGNEEEKIIQTNNTINSSDSDLIKERMDNPLDDVD